MSAVRAPVICLRFRGLSRTVHRRCSLVSLRIIDRTTQSMSQLPDVLTSLSAGDGVQAARHHTMPPRACTLSLRKPCIQVYVTKKPGNFGQHFLEICHSNRTCSSVELHQYHLERLPHQFFSQKNVGVARSQNSPRKRVFFAARGDAPLKNERRGDSRAQ